MNVHIRFESRHITSVYADDVRLGFMIEHNGRWHVYDDRTPPPNGEYLPISSHDTENAGRVALMALAPPGCDN